MIRLCIALDAFVIYLVVLFACHSVVEELSSSEYASPKWHARRPTAPTHDLCMAVTAALIAGIIALLYLLWGQFSYTTTLLNGLGVCIWGAHAIYRFAKWRSDEALRNVPHF